MPKIIDDSGILGRQGVNLVERTVLQMKHVWNPTTVDAGIDGVIEFREPTTGAMSNFIVQVQVKAGDSYFRSESDAQFTYYASKDDIEHWRAANTPVILVVCRPDKDEAYWINLKAEGVVDRSGKMPKIHFDKTAQRFNETTESRLRALAITKPWGFHLRPKAARETLVSNFMPVTFQTEKVYVAETDIREPGEFFDGTRGISATPDREFVLHAGKVFTVHDLRSQAYAKACDQGTVEALDLRTWIDENPGLAIAMMTNMLAEIAWRRDVQYLRRERLFFTKPTQDGSERVFRVEGRRVSFPSFYKRYPSKKDPTKIAYHRHRGFEAQFQQFEGRWLVAISPTYVFTSDGFRKHPYHEDYLKKINQIERAPAIFSHLKMWAAVLQPVMDLAADNYRYMRLEPLLPFELDRGIDDQSWKPAAHDEEEAEAVVEHQTALLGLES